MNVRKAKLDTLHHDPSNARKHDQRNLDAIAASLAQFGQVEPLVVQKSTGRVIGGNGRLEVMRKMGKSEADIVELDIDGTQAAALAIALNRTAELAAWDDETLAQLLDTLPADLRDAAGYNEGELKGLLDRMGVDIKGTDAPELPSGDKSAFQQMTFVVTDDQAGDIKAALQAAKDAGPFVDTGNENSNGNALARLAEAYRG